MLTVTVSGSFHRHMNAIYTAVGELTEAGVKVLSPSDPRVVDHLGEFLFVASDRLRSIRLVQDRHFFSIKASSFLWLVTPDGYVGQSASMEIGFATAIEVPIFSDTMPIDLTLQQYVMKVEGIRDCVAAAAKMPNLARTPHILVDPALAIESTHKRLDQLSPILNGKGWERHEHAEFEYNTSRRMIAETFGFSVPK